MVMRSWTVRTVAKTETRTVRRKSLNRIIPLIGRSPLNYLRLSYNCNFRLVFDLKTLYEYLAKEPIITLNPLPKS